MFLNDVLSWIEDVVCEENATAEYRYAPGIGVTANVLPRDSKNVFLRDWYVKEMEDYFASMGKQRRRKGKKRKMDEMGGTINKAK